MKWTWRFIVAAILTFGLILPVAWTQEPAPGEEPPEGQTQGQTLPQTSEGVARISIVDGNVATQRGDAGEWVATTVNAPVDRGDKVSTADHSRTEVQLDFANILRLNQNSVATIADLTRTRVQIQLAQGTMDYTVFKGSEADAEIDTPNMAVHPTQEGTYRIQVDAADQTHLTVISGQAEVTVPQGSTTVEQGQLITVQGTDNPQYQVASAPPKDDWDRWNQDRDREILSASSWQHTNKYYTGTQDLDRHGHWSRVPEYGDVWQPDEGPGWAPYRDGRWVWDPNYGWTWVSYEDWGWAPYHYGRWIDWDDSWYWWPGPVTPFFEPVWSPAWVSFFGFGWGFHHFGWGFGWGFGSFGWCPLGPIDPFFPWWGFGNSFSVVNVTNITNITNINNGINGRIIGGPRAPVFGSNLQRITTDPHIRGGISTVSADGFGTGRVPRNQRPITVSALQGGHVVNGRLPIVPTRASLSPTGKTVNRGAIPRGAGQSRFFSTHTPPARPASFTARAGEIQQMMKTQNTLRPTSVGHAATAERTAPVGNPGRGFTTSGETRQESPRTGQVTQPRAPAPSGWQRFGQGSPARAGNPRVATPRATSPNTNWRPYTPRTSQPSTAPAPAPRATPQGGGRTFQPRTSPRAESPRTQGQGGWQRFSPRTEAPPVHIQGGEQRSYRPRTAPAERAGWSQFSPRSESAPQPRVEGGRWERSAPSSGSSRPPLEIGRPIVNSPRYGGGGGQVRSGGWGGGGRPAGAGGSYSGSRGGGGGGSWGGGGARSSGGGGSASHSSSGGGGSHSSGGSSRNSSPHR
jgi:uncharacterized protein DUF6600/FecR-like protein